MPYEFVDQPQGRYDFVDEPKQKSPLNIRGEGYDKAMNYSPADTFAGALRGAGSIGATLLRPFESAPENATRRTSMDEALQGLGADPSSSQYKTAKLGTEMAGTWGIGGGLGRWFGLFLLAATDQKYCQYDTDNVAIHMYLRLMF